MKRATWIWIAVLAIILAPDAMAWGPKAKLAITASAARLLTREGTVPLSNLERDVQRGANAPGAVLSQQIPNADADPLTAIQSEMTLLQAVRGDRVDPYFAYRLGLLGSLVAQTTTPLSDAEPGIKALYENDVDNNIQGIFLDKTDRKIVDPPAYFAWAIREANVQKDVIVGDYRSGRGFRGTAAASLPADAIRSVNAVADVWYTIFKGSAVVANMPEGRVRDYIVSALQFYVERGNRQEVESAYTRLAALGPVTIELRKRIGDMFYDAGLQERAVQEYEEILQESPGRRDVAQRIADYYMKTGDDALKENAYEAAARAYASALRADPLHETARAKQIEAESLLAQKTARRETAKQAVERGRSLQTEAERMAMRNEFAEAIELLHQAQAAFKTVTDEFIDEARAAAAGQANTTIRLREYRNQLVAGAANLSGRGSMGDIRKLAEDQSGVLAHQSLEALIKSHYQKEMQQIRESSQNAMTPAPPSP